MREYGQPMGTVLGGLGVQQRVVKRVRRELGEETDYMFVRVMEEGRQGAS